MKKYTFTLGEINNTINKKNANNSIFGNYATTIYDNPSTDWSKVLDDLINADIAKKNASWLSSYATPKTETIKIKINDTYKPISMTNVYEFFNGYKLSSSPYKMDTIYYLADGTPFYFTKDYITIGFNTYYFYEFAKPSFICGLTDSFKKTIATIYIDGLKITIKK